MSKSHAGVAWTEWFDAYTEARVAAMSMIVAMDYDVRARGSSPPTPAAEPGLGVGKQTLVGAIQPHAPASKRTSQAQLDRRYDTILRLAGLTRAQWNNAEHGSFLGHPVTGHRSLLDALGAAEAQLRQAGHYDEIAAGIRSIAGLRPVGEADGTNYISAHAFGLAIDINKKIDNRFMGRSVASAIRERSPSAAERHTCRDDAANDATRNELVIIDDAMWLIRQEHFHMLDAEDNRTPIATLHQRYRQASDALVAYFHLLDDRAALIARMRAVGELPEGAVEAAAVERRHRQIATNRDSIRAANPFGEGAPGHGDIAANGFFDLDLRLVEALHAARLRWGGELAGGKDLMHFDFDRGPITEPRRREGSRLADREAAQP